MAVPRNRHSTARRNTRRANQGLRPAGLTHCASCAEPKMPHRACPSCGEYRGRKVMRAAE